MEHPNEIRDADALEAAFRAPHFLLFKHSQICPVSARAFAEYRAFSSAHPDVPTAWVDVIASRELSLSVAERTGVRHESPQALVLATGAPLWDASHGAITEASLGAATLEGQSGA